MPPYMEGNIYMILFSTNRLTNLSFLPDTWLTYTSIKKNAPSDILCSGISYTILFHVGVKARILLLYLAWHLLPTVVS